MRVRHQCSLSSESELVKLFFKRSRAGPNSTPEDAIESLATNLRRTRRFAARPVVHLDPFLAARNVVDFTVSSTLHCDGYLEARGCTFEDGFGMVVKKYVSEERVRFTIAHELCHTFFYELVPELKFHSHSTDDHEERLCNLGAAAFLMPAAGLRRRVERVPVSMEGLEILAEEYGVSVCAMFLRLRGLDAWKCELSMWRPLVDHTFKLEKLYGGPSLDWQWSEDSVPSAAWESKGVKAGETFLQYFDDRGVRRVKPVSYQVVRRGNSLIALWGKLRRTGRGILPLFDRQQA